MFVWSLFSFFLLSFIGILLFFLSCHVSLVGYINLLGGHWDVFDFCFKVDSLSLLFVLMLVVCGFVALFYCVHYYGVLLEAVGLFYLMVIFLSIMGGLVLSGSVVASLIFWEYLGFVSFILILYYSNMGSLRSAVVTLVSSRFGDVGLFMVFGLCFYQFEFSSILFSFFLSVVVLTKSACYPFVSWLVEAMRAPTPVSSLVHSSTLVAAGVWFFLRYSWVFDCFSVWLIFLSCCTTVLLSAFCACGCKDLKKIVAFSTCNNISWCILFFICGDFVLSCLQLLTHGICKCFLFMAVGDLMCSSDGSQDWNSVYSSVFNDFYGCFIRCFLVFCLTGAPFIGVFFSKHYFFCCCLYNYSFMLMLFLFCGFFFTFVYSFRFIFLLLGDDFGLGWSSYNNFYMISFLAICGALLNYVVGGLLEESFEVNLFWGIILLFTQVLGCVVSLFLYSGVDNYVFSGISSNVGGCDFFVSWFYGVYCFFRWFCCLSEFRWEAAALSRFLVTDFYFLSKFYGSSVGSSWLVFGVCCVTGSYLLFGLTNLVYLGGILVFRAGGDLSDRLVLLESFVMLSV